MKLGVCLPILKMQQFIQLVLSHVHLAPSTAPVTCLGLGKYQELLIWSHDPLASPFLSSKAPT